MSGEDDIPEEPRTVFMPPTARTQAQPGGAAVASEPPPTPPPARTTLPAQGAGRVEIGSVLNNIYEVKRLIGRGGMGEVFECVNVNDDHDRVAIKVMLPQLAADPNVQAMFRKEARTLTRLSHPAVVQYRVLAQEPVLGVFYIVTEFIDGEPLSDRLTKARPTSAELRGLTRRLAEGLRAAHMQGAVHRDMSPDNVLLPGGRLEHAKIIDFGIAKELDPSKATIVGDGFAGKLGFVAPEQFGDFGREIGPWTDVYSLGLVILTVAAGKPVDMGATLVEAIDRRRAGPDLSVAPEDLRPVLARMLAPNPVDRLRSMDEVIAMLDAAPAPTAAIPAPPTPAPASHKAPAPKAAPVAASGESAAKRTGPPLPLIIGGAAVAVLLAAGGGAFLLMGKSSPTPASLTVAGAPTVSAGAAAPAETVRRAIETALAQVPCSWLDIDSVSPTGGGVAVALTGVAGSTQAANSAIAAAARSVGVAIPDVNLANVLPADPKVCAALDAFRPFRADTSANGRRLSTSQTKYTLEKQPDGSLSQKAVVTMAIGDPSLDFSLFGIEPTGKIDGPLVPSRAVFMAALKDPENKEKLNDMGGDTYRLSIGMSPPVGLQGVLLLTGADLDAKLVGKAPAARGAGWAQQIAAAARRGGWKAEMVWYRLVDPTSS